MYFCAQEQSAHDLACDCSTSSVHKSMSQTDFFCSVCLLVLQVMCQSCALCSCTHKCWSETDIFCNACLLVLQSSQPALLFCCPPFTCLWFPTLRQPWKSPLTGLGGLTGLVSRITKAIGIFSFSFLVDGHCNIWVHWMIVIEIYKEGFQLLSSCNDSFFKKTHIFCQSRSIWNMASASHGTMETGCKEH